MPEDQGNNGRGWISDLTTTLDEWAGQTEPAIIVSPDLDGFLAAALLSDLFGARMVGAYTTKSLWLFDNYPIDNLDKALWLDLDVNRIGFRCIGHHIIRLQPNDTLPTRDPRSFNPNDVMKKAWNGSFLGKDKPGIRVKSRLDKYPFGTIHLLLAALLPDSEFPRSGRLAPALTHADGVWATARDYRGNCSLWAHEFFGDWPFLSEYLLRLTEDQEAFARQKQVHDELRALGLKAASSARRGGAAEDPWNAVRGMQELEFDSRAVHFQPPLANLGKLCEWISYRSGWDLAAPTSAKRVVVGEVSEEYPDRIKEDFGSWLSQKGVFSHAVTFIRTLRITKGISL